MRNAYATAVGRAKATQMTSRESGRRRSRRVEQDASDERLSGISRGSAASSRSTRRTPTRLARSPFPGAFAPFPRPGCTDSVKPRERAGASASLIRGRVAHILHRRASRPGRCRARCGSEDDADARRHLRTVGPVHAARSGRDARRDRAAPHRSLRAAPGALERVDPRPGEGHGDAEAALGRRPRWSASTATSTLPIPGGRAVF